jgi:hypothetical protein
VVAPETSDEEACRRLVETFLPRARGQTVRPNIQTGAASKLAAFDTYLPADMETDAARVARSAYADCRLRSVGWQDRRSATQSRVGSQEGGPAGFAR